MTFVFVGWPSRLLYNHLIRPCLYIQMETEGLHQNRCIVVREDSDFKCASVSMCDGHEMCSIYTVYRAMVTVPKAQPERGR